VVGNDGGVSAGTFAFVVGSGPLPQPQPRVAQPLDASQDVLTWILFGTAAVSLGALVSERFIWRGIEDRAGAGVPRMRLDAYLLIAALSAATLLAIVVAT